MKCRYLQFWQFCAFKKHKMPRIQTMPGMSQIIFLKDHTITNAVNFKRILEGWNHLESYRFVNSVNLFSYSFYPNFYDQDFFGLFLFSWNRFKRIILKNLQFFSIPFPKLNFFPIKLTWICLFGNYISEHLSHYLSVVQQLD